MTICENVNHNNEVVLTVLIAVYRTEACEVEFKPPLETERKDDSRRDRSSSCPGDMECWRRQTTTQTEIRTWSGDHHPDDEEDDEEDDQETTKKMTKKTKRDRTEVKQRCHFSIYACILYFMYSYNLTIEYHVHKSINDFFLWNHIHFFVNITCKWKRKKEKN